MTTSQYHVDLVVKVVRWVARISATLFAALILLIFVGGASTGFSGFKAMSAGEIPLLIAFIALWLGLVLGWKRELLGGLLTLSGVIAFYLLQYVIWGDLPGGPFLMIFSSPGVLYLFCGLVTGIRKNRSGA